MKTFLPWILGLAAYLVLASTAWAGEAKGPEKKEPEKKEAPVDPALIGEEVAERSEIEKILSTEYRKRRTAHVFFETSYDTEACKDYAAFCEKSYLDFLKWAGKPPETDLWSTRAHVVLIHNKPEFECLIAHRTRGQHPYIAEGIKNSAGTWEATPPTAILYSREGSGLKYDNLHIFHFLNHLFLHGLAGSGNDGTVWWLWESFSWHRSIELFGARDWRCQSFEGDCEEGMTPEGRAYNDMDEWMDLLKRAVRAKQDGNLIQFWDKHPRNIETKSVVKSWSLVRWFVRDEKEKARFLDFVSRLKTRDDQARALKEVYGMSPEDIDKAWREWILLQPKRWR